MYDFEVYTGKAPPSSLDKEYGKMGAVVVRLMEHLPKGVGHKVYMDNLFSNVNIFSSETSRYLGSWYY